MRNSDSQALWEPGWEKIWKGTRCSEDSLNNAEENDKFHTASPSGGFRECVLTVPTIGVFSHFSGEDFTPFLSGISAGYMHKSLTTCMMLEQIMNLISIYPYIGQLVA